MKGFKWLMDFNNIDYNKLDQKDQILTLIAGYISQYKLGIDQKEQKNTLTLQIFF